MKAATIEKDFASIAQAYVELGLELQEVTSDYDDSGLVIQEYAPSDVRYAIYESNSNFKL